MSLELLKKAEKTYGVRGTARLLQKSPTTVSQILTGSYPNPEYILKIVAEKFKDLEDDKMECPVLGTIHTNVCLKYEKMAQENKVHKDRLYMQVKGYCNECNYKKKKDQE